MNESMTEYVTRSAYTAQKSRLTRAKNSGDPLLILAAVERTLEEWHGKAWPDDWSRWARALDDAFFAYTRHHDNPSFEEVARFHAAFDRIH